jgi:hypothetical protein
VTAAPGQSRELTGAVTARVAAEGAEVGTIIVIVRGEGDRDAALPGALRALDGELHQAGIRLRLVTADSQLRRQLAGGRPSVTGPLDVHATLRTALLASYAELPGPGLVTSSVRIALARQAEALAVG